MFLALYKRFLLDLKEKALIISVLFTWLAVASVLTYFGKRFILFLITPLSIPLCASIYLLYGLITKRQNLPGLFKKTNRAIYYMAWGCIFSAVVILPLYNASKFTYSPILNKSWLNMLMCESKDGIRVFVMPQAAKESYKFEYTCSNGATVTVGPASIEMAGVIIVAKKGEAEALTEDDIKEILRIAGWPISFPQADLRTRIDMAVAYHLARATTANSSVKSIVDSDRYLGVNNFKKWGKLT